MGIPPSRRLTNLVTRALNLFAPPTGSTERMPLAPNRYLDQGERDRCAGHLHSGHERRIQDVEEQGRGHGQQPASPLAFGQIEVADRDRQISELPQGEQAEGQKQ